MFFQYERVFIIDDVVTTFGTIRSAIYALHQATAKDGWDACITGFGALIDRSDEANQPGVVARLFGRLLALGCRVRFMDRLSANSVKREYLLSGRNV